LEKFDKTGKSRDEYPGRAILFNGSVIQGERMNANLTYYSGGIISFNGKPSETHCARKA
jgi:hypothetical protein